MAGDITNPQSLNRYAYALDNPTTLTDPLGLNPQCPQASAVGSPPPGQTINIACNPEQAAQSNVSDPLGVFSYGFGNFGYSIWDALEGAPGTYISGEGGNLSWGFSIDRWRAYWAAQTSYQFSWTGVDPAKAGTPLEQQLELNAIQVGLAKCPTCGIDALQGLIQWAYDNMQLANPLTGLTTQDPAKALVGGNYNFALNDLGLDPGRYGDIDSLHVHSNGTFHVDTADPQNIFLAPIHLVFDVVGGHTWWAGGIPRPWWQ